MTDCGPQGLPRHETVETLAGPEQVVGLRGLS